MGKVLELKQKDKNNQIKTVGKLEFKNQEDTNLQELYFYGDIISDSWCKWSDEDMCPQEVADLLKEVDESKDLNIYINSGGGSVYAGLAIYNQLKRKKCNKIVHVDGLAASIASVIMLAGDSVIVHTGAQVMIHEPWQGLFGGYNSKELRKLADDLDKCNESICEIYSQNLKEGVDIETIKEMMSNETWFTGTELANYFNVEVEEGSEAVACVSSFFDSYKNAPKTLKNEVKKPVISAEDQALIDEINRKSKLWNLGGM